jgi:hypothetical protein
MVQSTGTAGDHLDLAYEADIAHPNLPIDIGYGALTFFRNKNPNGLSPTLHSDAAAGPWLRLAVKKDAYTAATAGTPDRCDRCELRDGKVKLGTPVWYSFDMRAEPGFPIVEARCVCAQIKAPYDDGDGGSPLFALRIDRGRYVATVEALYEPTDVTYANGQEISTHVTRYAGTGPCPGAAVRALDHHTFPNSPKDFKELQVRALLATDPRGLPPHLESEFAWCTDLATVATTGTLPNDIFAWSRFTVRLAPTVVKDADGIVELAITDLLSGEERLIATARGEFGNVGRSDPAPGDRKQYFKIGPYRDKLKIWGDPVAAIHVRNIKRGYWPRGAELRAATAKTVG